MSDNTTSIALLAIVKMIKKQNEKMQEISEALDLLVKIETDRLEKGGRK